MSIKQKTPQQLHNEARYCASERDRAELEAQVSRLETEIRPTQTRPENQTLILSTPNQKHAHNDI